MPLLKNKSKAAFKQNVRAEMAAGKPQRQALAIAYDVQRRSKADGGALLGLPIMPLTEDSLDRSRLMRQRQSLSPFEMMVGSGRTAYPRDSKNYRFHPRPDEPEYDLEIVGGPKKKWLNKDEEQPPVRYDPYFNATNNAEKLVRGKNEKMRDFPTRSMDAASRFTKKPLGEYETEQPLSMIRPDAPNAYMKDLSFMEKLRDAGSSLKSGAVSGSADFMGLPKTIASMPNRLSGAEVLPERYLDLMPGSDDYKKKFVEMVYGPEGKLYEPKTDVGKFSQSVGEISPYILAGGVAGGLRGAGAGLLESAASNGAVKLPGAVARGAGLGTAAGLRNSAPLAVTYPLYSGWADGGAIPFGVRESAKSLGKAGLIASASPGRADKVSGGLKAGSYVMPADVVSAMGQGNTMAGARALNGLMTMNPYNASGGRAPSARGMTSRRMKKFADGGAAHEEVPVNLSGGEFVFPPEAVAGFGDGDIDHGHQILDAMVKEIRRKNLAHISQLPPPRKD